MFDLPIIGFDIVEVAPRLDPSLISVLFSQNYYKMLGTSISENEVGEHFCALFFCDSITISLKYYPNRMLLCIKDTKEWMENIYIEVF